MSSIENEPDGSAADPSGLQAAISDGAVDADADLDAGERCELVMGVAEAMNNAVEGGSDPREVEKAVVGYVAGRMSTKK